MQSWCVPLSMAATMAAASGVYNNLFAPDGIDMTSSWAAAAPAHAQGQGTGSPQNGSSLASFTTSNSGAEGWMSLFDLLSDRRRPRRGLCHGVRRLHGGRHGARPPRRCTAVGAARWPTSRRMDGHVVADGCRGRCRRCSGRRWHRHCGRRGGRAGGEGVEVPREAQEQQVQ